MPLTTLDPGTALLVIDLQKGIVTTPTIQPISGIVACAASLAEAFRRHGLPVVLVNVAGSAPGRTEQTRQRREPSTDWTDFVPELHQQPGDHVVTKRTWGAFTATGLEGHLKQKGITQVVIAGVATRAGVESTARQAYERGFNVTIALDAITDTDAEAHHNSVTRIFPRLGETGTTREILALLADRSSDDQTNLRP